MISNNMSKQKYFKCSHKQKKMLQITMKEIFMQIKYESTWK